ncbi:MAG TPA: hypothetical protein DCP47_01390 [Phycisphaerales bacterium]|nr:hypothetical protein [Phycisphaerales bacterium]
MKTKKNKRTHHEEKKNREDKKNNISAASVAKYALNEASLKLLALEGKTIAECEALLGVGVGSGIGKVAAAGKCNGKRKTKKRKRDVTKTETSLNDAFGRFPELKAAFDRGRFLKNIAEFGGKNYTIAEAEGEFGLKNGELDKIFASDIEAADTWNQSRLKTLLSIKSKWLEMVGMASPAALKQLEKLMRREIAHQSIDFMHVTSKQMQELTGKTRQTIEYEWPKNYQMPKNSDGSYNLFAFIKWFEEYILRTKTGAAPKQAESAATNEKARKYKMENDERAGRLLDRGKVVAGLAARNQTILRIFAKALTEQKDPYIKQSLERAFEEIRREIAASMPELKLSEEQAARLKDLLMELNSDDKSEILNPKSETNSNNENSKGKNDN